MASRTLATAAIVTFVFSPAALAAVPPPPQFATDYATHFNQGNDFIRQTYYHRAITELREAIRMNPDYLPAHQALVFAYMKIGDFDLGWQEVDFIRHSGADVPDKFVRGLSTEISEEDAASKRAKNEQELEEARKIVNEQPKTAAAHARLGRACADAGDFPTAESESYAALALNPLEPQAHFVLGMLWSSDPPTSDQSVPHLRIFLQNTSLTPSTQIDIVLAHSMLSGFYTRRGMEPEALKELLEGLKADPENPLLLNGAAWIYATAMDASNRDPKQAVILAQRAVSNSKKQNAAILDTLGEAYYASGHFDKAISTEKKAIALMPEIGLFRDQLSKFQNAKRNAGSSKH